MAALASCQHPSVKVVAAVQSADGSIYTGAQVRSKNCDHCAACAEVVAIGAALTAGHIDLLACVAVATEPGGPAVWSPCGTCREILRDLHVGHVIVGQHPTGELTVATPHELLPYA
jgi:cytidine deaminase